MLSIWMGILTGTVFHSTEHGFYERRGGFPNMTVTYVHGDYLYNVLVRNGCAVPQLGVHDLCPQFLPTLAARASSAPVEEFTAPASAVHAAPAPVVAPLPPVLEFMAPALAVGVSPARVVEFFTPVLAVVCTSHHFPSFGLCGRRTSSWTSLWAFPLRPLRPNFFHDCKTTESVGQSASSMSSATVYLR